MEGTGKKQQIIETAIKCFSEKGYRGTSIQDIADTLGIAKGSMYFYFKSKEDLLHSICKYYLEHLGKYISHIEHIPNLSPREKLREMVSQGFRQYEEHKSFIVILMQERFELNEEIHELMIKARRQGLLCSQRLICKIYGQEVEPYACDAAFLFHSLIDGYLSLCIMEKRSYDVDKLADFVMKRTDEIVFGMITSEAATILGEEALMEWEASAAGGSQGEKVGVMGGIAAIRAALEQASLPEEQLGEIISSLQVMETEFEKVEPQPIVIKGMLSLIKSMKVNELKKHLPKLEQDIKDLIG
ncbi:TetR/AcrR family transcriptional regulator [Paenibacillus oenotherae]|uniref:TetR/AcrR family transcriptional regulator n=1 Tax=Paenibacillus oenotherae TaxID=1435645 RepID=A0ABS7D8L4_9BACL|nr:TetR/AcrR family transcriptional regulator [Paenibacillus oenotherae]